MKSKIVITGRHLSDASSVEIEHKLEKLLHHNHHILRIRLDLHEVEMHRGELNYTAKAKVELRGSNLVASETTNNLYKSIHCLVDKLDRMVTQHARRIDEKRHNLHGVDLPVELPKVAT